MTQRARAAAGGTMTAREYFALPESLQPTNLLEGELVVSPSPNTLHQEIAGRLYASLLGFADGRGGHAFIAPLDVELDANVVLQPDVGYVRPGRMAIVQQHIVGAPDLVVEVRSPGHDALHRRKMELFVRYGVEEAWVVEPDERTVEVLRNRDGACEPAAKVAFGEAIPSRVVEVGDGGLGRVP